MTSTTSSSGSAFLFVRKGFLAPYVVSASLRAAGHGVTSSNPFVANTDASFRVCSSEGARALRDGDGLCVGCGRRIKQTK